MSLTPQSVGILNSSAKKARGMTDGGGWAAGGVGRGALLNRAIDPYHRVDLIVDDLRIGLLGALTIVTPVLMKRAPTGGLPGKSSNAPG